jgi:VIT family
MAHRELHRSGRAGWLRAAVLGADDGIVSTASLVIGVAAAAASRNAVLLAGVAGLAAGATSMAAGEYVSVSSRPALCICSPTPAEEAQRSLRWRRPEREALVRHRPIVVGSGRAGQPSRRMAAHPGTFSSPGNRMIRAASRHPAPGQRTLDPGRQGPTARGSGRHG